MLQGNNDKFEFKIVILVLTYHFHKGATPFTITETIEETQNEHLLTYISSSPSQWISLTD